MALTELPSLEGSGSRGPEGGGGGRRERKGWARQTSEGLTWAAAGWFPPPAESSRSAAAAEARPSEAELRRSLRLCNGGGTGKSLQS